MKHPILLCLVASVAGWAQQTSVGSISQKGTCTVAGVTGNVTVNCPGLDPSIIRVLNEQFSAQLKERDLRIDQITDEANVWKDKFLDLTTRLADAGVNDGLQRRAEALLKQGKLEDAGNVLDEALAGEEKTVDQIAENQFNRAAIFQLQFRPLEALSHYEKAYSYRPSNPQYGKAYADVLYVLRDFEKAQSIYKSVLDIRRASAKTNPQVYLPEVAATLNLLGNAYLITQQVKEAHDAYTDAFAVSTSFGPL